MGGSCARAATKNHTERHPASRIFEFIKDHQSYVSLHSETIIVLPKLTYMWESIARQVLKFRLLLLLLRLSATAFMAYHASKVRMSYDFTRTVPTDNIKYKEYEDFRKKFGDDGN